MNKTLIGNIVRTSALATAIFAVNTGFAADSDFAGLEEVVVTAQKREATLQDTPVAVSAVGGESLKEQGISEIKDLSLAVPSLNITQSASSSQQVFSIRGIGTSGFNAGLEPSVGVFIDGVYRSRASSAIDDFIAVERVEVLRGPQSTVFGKNTPAGVISIVTQKPEREFGFDIEQSFGNYNSRVTRGTVTGPINETTSFRISGNSNKRDGFVDNIFDGREVNDRDRYSLRGQLLIEPTDELTIRFIADGSSISEECCAGPFVLQSGLDQAGLLAAQAQLITPLDEFSQDVAFDGDLKTEQEQYGFSMQVDYETDNYLFTSLTAYRDFDEENDIDADFGTARSIDPRNEQTKRQVLTQEFRLQSTGDNVIDWQVGYYYYDSDQKFEASTIFGEDFATVAAGTFNQLAPGAFAGIESLDIGFLATIAANDPSLTPAEVAQLTFIATDPVTKAGFEQQLGTLLGYTPDAQPVGDFLKAGDGLLGSEFDLGTTSHSVFGKLDWHATDQLTVSLGLRWSTEDKDIKSDVNIRDPYAELNFDNLIGHPVFGGLTALSALQINLPVIPAQNDLDRSESETTGNLIVSYELNDDVNLYASYNRGYKAGGYNVSADAANTSVEFSPEIADAWEAGAKVRFWDNRAQVNATIFSQRIRDFQANLFTGVGFALVNAGRLETDGLELEGTFAPIENLIVTFAATYLDSEYGSFVNGPRTVAQQFASIQDQDLSGEDQAGVPEWVVSSSFTYSQNLGPVDGFINAAARYRGSRNTLGSLEEIGEQDAYTTVNATVGVRSLDGLWSLSLWGNNIFDEEHTDITFKSVGSFSSFSNYPGDPRTYGMTLRVQY